MTDARLGASPLIDDEDAGREINLAPMLDVIFILLIFFIVTASFVKEMGVEVSRPDAISQPGDDEQAITLRIDENGYYSVNGYGLTRDGLASYLRRLRAQMPTASFSIQASPQAHTQHLVTAVDGARLAGWERVPLLVPSE